MKKLLLALAWCCLAGCDYTVPLVEKPKLDIDQAIVGRWERTKKGGQTEVLLVLPLGQREYLVSIPAESEDALFARACLGRAGDRTLVQLTWFGTALGSTPENDRVFQYAAYSVEANKLTVRMLNTAVVAEDLDSTEALTTAITANRDHEALFKEAMVFEKSKE